MTDSTRDVAPEHTPEPDDRRQRNLANLVEDAELFVGAKDGQSYATVRIKGVRQPAGLQSRDFRGILARRASEQLKTMPTEGAVNSALAVLEAKARNSGVTREVGVRVHAAGRSVWLDLTNEQWECVEVTADGWGLGTPADVRFVRGRNSLALPQPVRGGSIEDFRELLNVDDDGFALVVGFLLASLRPKEPYALLALHGEQASGKSTATKVIRSIVDPARAATRAMPSGGDAERDLFISAARQRILAFDNISSLSWKLSDALCRLTDGSGYARRTLYTDADETVFSTARPIILNGIESVVQRDDLMSRTLLVELHPIDASERRSSDEVSRRFAELHPQLLGVLLDGVSAALRASDGPVSDPVTRLIDLERWVARAEIGIGWDGSRFRDAIRRNLTQKSEAAVETNDHAAALLDFLDGRGADADGVVWQGTSTELREQVTYGYSGPPSEIGKSITRISELVRAHGYEIRRYRTAGGRRRIVEFTRHVRHPDTARDK